MGGPTNFEKNGQGPAALAEGAGALFGHFFLVYHFFFSFPPSLEDGPMYTEILSQRDITPKRPTKKPVEVSVDKESVTLNIHFNNALLNFNNALLHKP